MPAVRILQIDDQAVFHRLNFMYRLVDFTGANAHPLTVECCIRATKNSQGTLRGNPNPIAMTPHPGVIIKITGLIAQPAGIVPEKYRHGRHRTGDDHLANFPNQGRSGIIISR